MLRPGRRRIVRTSVLRCCCSLRLLNRPDREVVNAIPYGAGSGSIEVEQRKRFTRQHG